MVKPVLDAMPTVALLGTGLLGEAIGVRLLQQGIDLRVWNRDPRKAQSLIAKGARSIPELAGAAGGCASVITVLRDGPVTAEVVAALGPLDGACCMPMGTMGVSESCALELQVRSRGGAYLEAPVLGSKPEALKGSLLVMAGGDEASFHDQLPLLRLLSEKPMWMGATGSGSACKLALNQLIASLTHGYSLALRLVEASGLEVEKFMDVLRPSALYAPTVDKKLERMLRHHYEEPNFTTALLRKDLLLFLREASLLQINTSGLDSLAALLGDAEQASLDGLDYSALHELTTTTASE